MYWNGIGVKKELICYKLNSNIRCIGMAVLKDLCWYVKGWIVTLDVLKSIVKEGKCECE